MKMHWVLGITAGAAIMLGGTLRSFAADRPESQQAVEIKIVMIEHHVDAESEDRIDLNQTAEEIAGRVGELESSGKIASVDRIRLTTLENQRAQIQTGQQVAIRAGQAFSQRGGPPQINFERVSIGTLVSAMVKVDAEVLSLALEIEKSQFDRPGEPSDEESFRPDGIATLTSQVTLTLKTGHTALVTSKETAGGDKVTQQVILASARLIAGPEEKKAKDETQVRIFPLKFLQAEQAGSLVRSFAGETDELSIAVDTRKNALIVRGKDNVLTLVQRLIEALDTAGNGEESDR